MNNIKREHLQFLIDKKLLKEGMYVDIDKSDTQYKIIKIIDDGKFYKFHVKKMVYSGDGDLVEISGKEITKVDEMDFMRYIQSYEIDEALSTITIDAPTDIVKTLIGKKEGILEGHELEDDMKIILLNDKTEKYNNKLLTVKGVGEKIQFVCPRGRPKKK